ncbi:MCE family protein [Rhodococcus qingshengii]|uniref:MCE family protein n=1 Tax=Rhodococcus qingshengii TaxID=334542 RepID=UPI0024B8C387|nr:MCE family protein [Rhodococcus qingshengii]MDJ0441103.1 MCE family protein [Rhodococcus qingshengii]
MQRRKLIHFALVVAASIVAGTVAVATSWHFYTALTRTSVTAYFTSTNGLYTGDDVLILGLKVGAIDDIEPQGDRVKVTFHFEASVNVPKDVKAVILSPSLVSSRAIQLSPAFTGGEILTDGDSIDISRTAVPVEWDDFRAQLDKLAGSLGPTDQNPSGPLGSFIDSSANTLSGKGDQINTTINKLADATTTLSDGRKDLFSIIRNLQVFVNALSSSDQQIVDFNGRLASVTDVLTNSDSELANALDDIDSVTGDLQRFISDNRDGIEHAVNGLASVTSTLDSQRPVIEQLLHVAPNAFANFYNIYQPAQGALTGALAVSQMQNPVQFICGAIQAASQLGAEESAKLCVQYLGPVLSSIRVNYPSAGLNAAAGVQAQPDQVDFSEPFLDPRSEVAAATVPSGSGLPGLMGDGQR